MLSGPVINLTVEPERPFLHPYHQTLTMKMFMAQKGSVYVTFEHALDVIQKIDQLTRGIRKIIYLVGWQYEGHDSKYPAWFEVNHRLKRSQDETAGDSLKWLMDEAFKFHTTVSLHINMLDALEDSPLWDTYVANDILAREKDGSLRTYKWGYPISYTREWDTGFAQKRIDALCQMLPLARAGTVHIDAFHSLVPLLGDESYISPYHEIPVEQEIETQKRIFRYWRDQGIDVTSEFATSYRKSAFIGLQPMAWHFHGLDPMQVPASLYCGGKGGDPRFGTSMLGEGIIRKDPQMLAGFLAEFCQTTLPWYYLNCLERLRMDDDGVVHFSDQVTSELDKEGIVVIKQNNVLLRKGDDLFMPALWRDQPEIIAFSQKGYQDRVWKLPADWQTFQQADLFEIGLEGLKLLEENQSINNGEIKLSLKEGQAISILPR
ncbi:MAG: hypothetical protein JWN30_2572 [Bacilli bacterium]|nr:hypothetical protein [Bacilli bacterium]